MSILLAVLLAAGGVRVSQPLPLPVPVPLGGTGTTTGGFTTSPLAVPVNGTFTTACTGGSLTHSTTYYYRVTAVNAVGETTASTETSKATGACGTADTSTITVTWGAVPGAASYNVYGRTVGAETKITASAGTTVLTYTDTGSSLSGSLPVLNSTDWITGGDFIAAQGDFVLSSAWDAVFFKYAPNLVQDTGADNAIVVSYVNPINGFGFVDAGTILTIKLAHALQAGANTLTVTGSVAARNIRSHRNPASNIATAYVSGGYVQLVYDGTQWLDLSQ